VILGKVRAIAPKWGDMLEVDLYCYSGECYTESLFIRFSYTSFMLRHNKQIAAKL